MELIDAYERMVEIFKKQSITRLERYEKRLSEGWRVLAGDDGDNYSRYCNGHKYG